MSDEERLRELAVSAGNRLYLTTPSRDEIERVVLRALRAAVDNPADDPTGTVRKGPKGTVVAKVAREMGPLWMPIQSPNPDDIAWMKDEGVRGWTVIGAVPGTKAWLPK